MTLKEGIFWKLNFLRMKAQGSFKKKKIPGILKKITFKPFLEIQFLKLKFHKIDKKNKMFSELDYTISNQTVFSSQYIKEFNFSELSKSSTNNFSLFPLSSPQTKLRRDNRINPRRHQHHILQHARLEESLLPLHRRRRRSPARHQQPKSKRNVLEPNRQPRIAR